MEIKKIKLQKTSVRTGILKSKEVEDFMFEIAEEIRVDAEKMLADERATLKANKDPRFKEKNKVRSKRQRGRKNRAAVDIEANRTYMLVENHILEKALNNL